MELTALIKKGNDLAEKRPVGDIVSKDSDQNAIEEKECFRWFNSSMKLIGELYGKRPKYYNMFE